MLIHREGLLCDYIVRPKFDGNAIIDAEIFLIMYARPDSRSPGVLVSYSSLLMLAGNCGDCQCKYGNFQSTLLRVLIFLLKITCQFSIYMHLHQSGERRVCGGEGFFFFSFIFMADSIWPFFQESCASLMNN